MSSPRRRRAGGGLSDPVALGRGLHRAGGLDLLHHRRLESLPCAVVAREKIRGTVADMADAEAIAEAASRPTMRFVEVKSPAQQGLGMILRLRHLLVGQRTQTVNALRGHLAEFGIVTGKGRENVDKLRSALNCDEEAADLPASVRQMAQLCFDQIDDLSRRIGDLDAQIAAASKRSRFSARLQKMPGVGPITAMALAAFAPPMETFRRGRDFSAWLGLVPRQHSSGGKPRLGRTSKSGQRDIRRLLIIGAMAVISGAKIRPPAENS